MRSFIQYNICIFIFLYIIFISNIIFSHIFNSNLNFADWSSLWKKGFSDKYNEQIWCFLPKQMAHSKLAGSIFLLLILFKLSHSVLCVIIFKFYLRSPTKMIEQISPNYDLFLLMIILIMIKQIMKISVGWKIVYYGVK